MSCYGLVAYHACCLTPGIVTIRLKINGTVTYTFQGSIPTMKEREAAKRKSAEKRSGEKTHKKASAHKRKTHDGRAMNDAQGGCLPGQTKRLKTSLKALSFDATSCLDAGFRTSGNDFASRTSNVSSVLCRPLVLRSCLCVHVRAHYIV